VVVMAVILWTLQVSANGAVLAVRRVMVFTSAAKCLCSQGLLRLWRGGCWCLVTVLGRLYHVPTDFALSFIPSWWPFVCINIGGCFTRLFSLFDHMSCIPNLPAGTCLATATALSVGEACLANLPAQPRHRAYTAFEWASCLVEGCQKWPLVEGGLFIVVVSSMVLQLMPPALSTIHGRLLSCKASP